MSTFGSNNVSDIVLGAHQRTWARALFPLACVIVVLLTLYWGTASAMVTIWWRSETFTHAFIVPPMVLWLAWRKRAELVKMTPKPAYWFLLPMAAVAGAWFLGELVAVNAVTQLALVALMVLTVPVVLGTQVARALMFPLGFAFFAVPIGEFALPVLMQWTADFTVGALRLSGVPVFREGLRFVIPTGSWSVVEACSGVRYLIASFMVGSLFAYLNYQSNKRRWIFMGLSILVPIVANWVRAYMIVMLGHLSNNKIATGVDHLIYGWVFFGVVIMALFTIGARWSEAESSTPDWSTAPGLTSASNHWPAALWVALIVAVPIGGFVHLNQAREIGRPKQITLPNVVAGGGHVDVAGAVAWVPAFENPTATARRDYATTAGAKVGVQVVYFQQQREESKLVSSNNAIVNVDDRYWNPISTASRTLNAVDGRAPVVVRETVLLATDQTGQATRERVKVWMLYWVDGQWTSSDLQAKVKGAWGRLNGRGDEGAAVLLYATDSQAGGADAALSDFWRDNASLIEARLVAARDGKP